MKRIIVITALFAAVLASCDKKEDSTSSEIQRDAVVTALSKYDELSEFVSLLQELYVADIKAEEFTVFAIKNEGIGKLDEGINLKRHIVVRKYSKSALSNGMQMVALDGTVLKVVIMGERVYVNGIELGKEISAGNSIAYIVEKPIATDFHVAQYSFTVYECNAAWSPSNTVPYLAASSAVISLCDSLLRELESYTTDINGNLTITIVEGLYYYKVTKGSASNISKDGFLIAGIFTSQEEIYNSPQQSSAVVGGLKFVDWNGDGIIRDDDKPLEGFVWLQSAQVVHIAVADFTPTYQ